MNIRNRLVITALLLCHLLLAPSLVTSQLQSSAVAPKAGVARAVGEQVVIKAREQEKHGDVFHLRGDVEITYRDYVFTGDQMTYDSASGEINANGNLEFHGGPHDEHLKATHAVYNVNTENGRFFDVVGTTGVRFRGKNVILTSSEPFAFSGREVEKLGRDKIVIHHGSATTCRLPHPKWTFNAQRLVVVPGQDAKIYHSTFRILGVPVFYFPFATHPVEHLGRKTGILIPSIGQSSRKGTIIGESIFWAINRSADATLGAEYFSKRGWAQHGEFRAKPSESWFINARYFGVVDRGILVPATTPGVTVSSKPSIPAGFALQDQGGQELRVNAEGVVRNLRAVGDIDYLSNFLFRLAFAETFTQAINSEVRSTGFVSNNWRGFSFGTHLDRYQNFQSALRGDVITIVHAPTFEASSVDRRIANTPFVWSFDAAIDGLSRREPSFVTADVVGRLDLHPRFSLPLLWRGWSLRPEVALRDTYYTDRLLPEDGLGRPDNEAVNRRALETAVELRPPALARIFGETLFDYNYKHVFEPRLIYRNVSGVSSFANILRFDERDILSDTHELEYAFVNRLYAKRVPRPVASCTNLEAITADQRDACNASPAREIISWEVAQKYFIDPNFGGAVVSGRRNVFTTTAEFTGIAFVTEPRRFSPVISRLRVRSTATTDIEWHLDYDTRKGRISSSMASVNHRFLGDFNVGAAYTFLRSPGEVVTSRPIATPPEFNQYRVLLQYGRPNKRGVNAAATLGYDVNLNFLQYSAFQSTYNWDCCGLSFEYRRFALGAVRNENQFRFALTLANVGTFGTLRKQERLF